MEFEEIYADLKKKYGLPEFEVIDEEFEICSMEEDIFILRGIRRRIVEKFDAAIKLFSELLHPEAGFTSYQEANVFSETERELIMQLYRQLMFFNRLSAEIDFNPSDDSDAKFIADFMKEWPELKKSITFFLRKLKESWHKDRSKKENVGYLG